MMLHVSSWPVVWQCMAWLCIAQQQHTTASCAESGPVVYLLWEKGVHLTWVVRALTGYSKLQATKPQTIGFALNDSPVGEALAQNLFACSEDGHHCLYTTFTLLRAAVQGAK